VLEGDQNKEYPDVLLNDEDNDGDNDDDDDDIQCNVMKSNVKQLLIL